MLSTPVHVRPAYASYGWSSYVVTFHESSTKLERVIALEKKGSRHNLQHAGWPIRVSMPSFSPDPTNEALEKAKTSINSRLLGLPGPYHRHVIGMFNTCSRGPTHRSLTDTGGGYNLGGADLPHTTPWPSQPTISTFHLRALPGLQFNQEPSKYSKVLSLVNLWPSHGLSTTQSSTVAYIYA
jgi:hypothetical protein